MINHGQKIDCRAFVSEKYFRHFSENTFSAESEKILDPLNSCTHSRCLCQSKALSITHLYFPRWYRHPGALIGTLFPSVRRLRRAHPQGDLHEDVVRYILGPFETSL